MLWVLRVTNALDHCVEAVVLVGGVLDDASGAIGLGEGIRTWGIESCQLVFYRVAFMN